MGEKRRLDTREINKFLPCRQARKRAKQLSRSAYAMESVIELEINVPQAAGRDVLNEWNKIG